MDLYGGRGFTKRDLMRVEEAGGLSPKGYIPVLRVGDEVLRESTVCVERIASLAPALAPADPARAAWMIRHCDGALAPDPVASQGETRPAQRAARDRRRE